MTSLTTKGRYAKARQKEKAIQLIQAKGLDVEEAFSRVGLKISRYSYPRILARYRAQGLEGLVDPRGGKRFEKLTDGIKAEIRTIREQKGGLTAAQICDVIKKRHSIKVHHSHMSRILAHMGLSGPVGRPSRIETSHEMSMNGAGSFFLKAALLAMDLPKAMTGVVLGAVKEVKKDDSRRRADKGKVLSANPLVIRQKIETLLFMPVFDMERMWHLERKPSQRGLGVLTRLQAPYKYRTMDNFLREISRLDIVEPLNKTFVKRYARAFRVRVDDKKWQTFYMNSHHKLLWARDRIHKDGKEDRRRVPRHRDVYVLHDFRGRPLLSVTRPGGGCASNGLFDLIDTFEGALDTQAVRLSVFSCREIPVNTIDAFVRRKRSFIAGVQSSGPYTVNHFQGAERRSWEAYRYGEGTSGGAEEILDCHKTLEGGSFKRRLRLRTILVRKQGNKAVSFVITNIPREKEPDGKRLVDTYRTQRDGHQTAFRQIRPSFYIDPTSVSPPRLSSPELDFIGEDRSGSPKEDILTLLEVALNNAHIFVKEHYLPEQFQRLDFATAKDLLYKQPGRLIEGKRAIKIMLNRYEEEPDHQALAEYAAQRVNEAGLVTEKGKRLVMAVSGSQ